MVAGVVAEVRMEIDIRICDGPIEGLARGAAESGSRAGELGARVEFWGTVRSAEGGQEICALQYEAYAPMAEGVMRRILEELGVRHPCLRVRVFHRTGNVPVGEAAIYVGVEAVHRAEAFGMASDFMNRLKQDVPIWKSGVVP